MGLFVPRMEGVRKETVMSDASVEYPSLLCSDVVLFGRVLVLC